ncbi:inovirus Gp2 family protein [Metapseudomonas lalkuanensis]|uniref:Inovirus Gp2 family protein n=1 Tax=Metapseudomonas lalkuanensis TaxID=2604832 RepID=A0A5J6QMX4_9GAMM|nr:inovirus Gp2 family protein [Pseudomonas lalkuanensis]QEY63793.1 inovirus Gp2 family protein [Pseudomonas lalkuanensis]
MYYQPPLGSTQWQGLSVQLLPHEIKFDYLMSIHSLLSDIVMIHPRWTVIRLDLHVPEGCVMPQRAITDFIESLKSQLAHAQSIKTAAGKRAYNPMLRYVWVREWESSRSPHYHLALMLSRDAYFSLGDYTNLQSDDCSYDQMLAGRIFKAWGVALGLDWTIAMKGVLFAPQPVSPLQVQHKDFEKQFRAVFYRLSYFAKKKSKVYGDGQRNFGMSQLSRLQTAQP